MSLNEKMLKDLEEIKKYAASYSAEVNKVSEYYEEVVYKQPWYKRALQALKK